MNLILFAMLLMAPQRREPAPAPHVISIGEVFHPGAEAAFDYHTDRLPTGEFTVTLTTKAGVSIKTSGVITLVEGARHLVFVIPETAPHEFYYISDLKQGYTNYTSADQSVGIFVE